MLSNMHTAGHDTRAPAERRLPHVLVDARFGVRLSGGQRCAYALSSYLSNRGEAHYSFLTYAHGAELLKRQGSTAPLVIAPYTPEMHPGVDVYEHLRLPRLGRRMRVDLYHATFQVLPYIAPAPRTILTVHDMAVFSYPQAYGRRFVRYMRFLLRTGIRRATRVIAVSDATRREIIGYFPSAASRIVTIPNGVGPEFVAAATLSPDRVRGVLARLDIPTPYVLFVGNLEPKKNLPRLLEAFQRLRRSAALPQHLVIAGTPPPAGPDSGIPREAMEDTLVHFAGFVDDADLPALYRGADLVAFPSIYEGFGMPVLEAMAAGVPVLTSSISSLPEVAGGAAVLVDPFDVDAMAAGLHRGLTDLAWRQFAVTAGRRRAEQLSWDANARQTEMLYFDLWERMCRTAPL